LKIQIRIIDEKGNFYEGTTDLKKTNKKNLDTKLEIKKQKKIPSNVVTELYKQNFFSEERQLNDVVNEMKKLGYNFGRSSIYMAVSGADFLKQKGTKGKFKFIQKYPA